MHRSYHALKSPYLAGLGLLLLLAGNAAAQTPAPSPTPSSSPATRVMARPPVDPNAPATGRNYKAIDLVPAPTPPSSGLADVMENPSEVQAAQAAAKTVREGMQDYTDDDFKLTLPTTWRAKPRDTSARHAAEFVNGERGDGYLRLRSETSDVNTTAADAAFRDQDQRLRYLPGFLAGKSESFRGNLNGTVAGYEFTQAGKPMQGRIYYLQADARTIYTLHFTGSRDKLTRLRSVTDAIARSFQTTPTTPSDK